jgi:predicted outer membrane repeat protein
MPDTSVILTGNVISFNTTVSCGGGIYLRFGSDHVLTDNIILGNTAAQSGGGINFSRCNANVERCTITGNESGTGGGGIAADQGTRPTTYIDCTISGNESSGGGGLHQLGSAPVFSRCQFLENHSRLQGGGIYSSAAEPVFENCVFKGNSSVQEGGAFYSKSSDPLLENCTIVGNGAANGGALAIKGIYHTPIIVNSILWTDSPNEIFIDTGQVTVSYSDVQGGWEGEGIIDLPPRFVDFPAGDLHLKDLSPCIDAGDPAYIPDPDASDIDGEPRIMRRRVDMGIDEVPYRRERIPEQQ